MAAESVRELLARPRAGGEVTVRGWLRTARHAKEVSFLEVSDGSCFAGIQVEIKRMLLAKALQPQAGNKPLVDAIQKHGRALFGQEIPAMGTPLYTDVRLYGEAGIPGVIYGAGPRTVLESNAKRADERLDLEDLRRATKVVARTLRDLL